jgi:predicted DNA-binding antitoxin AbrB/MazE fold protein
MISSRRFRGGQIGGTIKDMAITIPAKYENGVFRPLQDVQIEEGTIVDVHVSVVPGKSATQPRSVRDFEFCGMWKDREDMADSVEYVNRLRGNLRGSS